jgi:PAS domain S-box-containing protein
MQQTSRREKMADLASETDLLFAALQTLPIALVATDAHGIVLSVNAALTSLIGYNAEEVVGQSVTLLSFGSKESSVCDILQGAIRSSARREECPRVRFPDRGAGPDHPSRTRHGGLTVDCR